MRRCDDAFRRFSAGYWVVGEGGGGDRVFGYWCLHFLQGIV